MNELVRKIAVTAAIFCSAVLLMSLAAVVMMHAGEQEVPYGGNVGNSSSEVSKNDGKDPDKAASEDPAGQEKGRRLTDQ